MGFPFSDGEKHSSVKEYPVTGKILRYGFFYAGKHPPEGIDRSKSHPEHAVSIPILFACNVPNRSSGSQIEYGCTLRGKGFAVLPS